MKIKDLKDKRIAIWGLGIEGNAVLEILKNNFPDKEITIIDDNSFADFSDSKNCNPNILNILKNIEVVIRSPGVSIYKSEIIYAKKNFNTIFITEKSIFFSELEHKKVKTIAITGTKGKTTTSKFCYYLLKLLGYKTLLLGNMGLPTISALQEAKKADFVVIEMSSYQTSDLISFPSFAILLNLFPEHLIWHLTHENYYKDKINLLNGAENKIVNASESEIFNRTKNLKNLIYFNTKEEIHYENNYFYNGKQKLFSSQNMLIKGEHNYKNFCSIFQLLKILNINLTEIKQEYLDKFEPIEHRLQIINNKNIIFVNDSISTIPESTIACYETFQDKSIYSILGGLNRQQDYTELIKYILLHKNIKFLSLIGDTGKLLKEILEKNNFQNFSLFTTLKESVEFLYQKAKNDKNAVILLSPASASYGMYKNFEERGKDFQNIIKSL